jgi:hypothetical protein
MTSKAIASTLNGKKQDQKIGEKDNQINQLSVNRCVRMYDIYLLRK